MSVHRRLLCSRRRGGSVLSLGVALLSSLVVSGCLVRASRYDEAVREGNAAHEDASRAHEQIRQLRAQLGATRDALQVRDRRVAELSTQTANLQARLDEATALHQQLQKALERLGKNVGAMLADKGALQQALDDAKNRLAELRALQSAAQARNAEMAAIVERLERTDKGARIGVRKVGDQDVLTVPGALLFEPGRAELKRAAESVLQLLARVLSASRDWQFRITSYLPSQAGRAHQHGGLAMSAARAGTVADRLVALGVAPSSLSATGQVAASAAAGGASDDASGTVEIEIVAGPPSTSPAVGAGTTAPTVPAGH